MNIPEKIILINPLNWILSWNEWINHILNQTSLWIDLVEIKWRVSFHSKFTRFFEDKLCTSKSNYTANIFPSTILKKEEELDSPKLVANVTTWVPYTTLKRFPSCYATSSIITMLSSTAHPWWFLSARWCLTCCCLQPQCCSRDQGQTCFG